MRIPRAFSCAKGFPCTEDFSCTRLFPGTRGFSCTRVFAWIGGKGLPFVPGRGWPKGGLLGACVETVAGALGPLEVVADVLDREGWIRSAFFATEGGSAAPITGAPGPGLSLGSEEMTWPL